MNNEKECAVYFRMQKGYHRCMEELWKKWRSYGRAAGKITLRHTSEEERRAIGGMTGKRYLEDTICFTFAEVEQGLQKTRFAPVDVRKMLEAYFGKKLITKQEQREQEETEKQAFLKKIWDSMREKNEAEPAAQWLSDMISEKKYGWQIVMREYEKNERQAEKMVCQVCSALGWLKQWKEGEEMVPLAVAAAEISGNPHLFDRNTTEGTLFVQALCWYKKTEIPENTYQWRELLQRAGIVPDNISSMVHVFGMRLKRQEQWHPAYEIFYKEKESCVVTMENLKGITGAVPMGDCVYIVENEMVFSYLLDQMKRKKQWSTLLCTSGQPRFAAVKLLELLADAGVSIYYSGDLDPDGIGIAERLWQRFGEVIHIWRMAPEDYRKSLSGETFGEAGQKKLEHIFHPVLRKTAELVKKTGKAGYQENILKELSGDIIRESRKKERI